MNGSLRQCRREMAMLGLQTTLYRSRGGPIGAYSKAPVGPNTGSSERQLLCVVRSQRSTGLRLPQWPFRPPSVRFLTGLEARQETGQWELPSANLTLRSKVVGISGLSGHRRFA